MKKLLFCLIPAAFFSYANAQKTDALQQKYASYISVDDARKHLTILASDAFEGRETGQPGAEKAANYLAGEFKKMGLQAPVNGSYFLDVPLEENTLKVTAFSINNLSFENGKDFLMRGTFGNTNTHATEVIFIGYGTSEEIGTTDLSGKVLLWINEDKPEAGATPNTSYRMSAARTKIIREIQSKHPAVILAANVGIADVLKRFGSSYTGSSLSLKKETPAAATQNAPVINIDLAVADALTKPTGQDFNAIKTASAAGVVPAKSIKFDFTVAYHTETKPAKAVDVLGFLPGSDPKLKDEILVFSAHYDHIGLTTTGTDKVNNGADDDGSGTTGILEIARAFTQAKKDGHPARRSILFLGNVGEEKGLLGSEYYTDHPVFPLSQTITDLNIDMIGRTGYDYQGKADSSNYVYVIGSAMLSSDLHKINEEANNKFTKLDLDYKYDDPNDPNRFYYRSDHYNFAKHGVPIIFYFDGEHQDYHRPSDEVSKINFPMLVKRAQLVFYTGWDLANRDKRPVVDAKSDKAASQ
ncbi:M28 family peptidase [uncultured Mucilaginibacter sp.]|uniref:M28 family peptidase n=1 Tax=uncultured Mucilaginibacter sp. TaxID=797541 RepID=UPI0026322773|nr:M28 family peptidase [uncultured Mucilaginibacter sp.]